MGAADADSALCKTQQGYSPQPLRRGRKMQRQSAFAWLAWFAVHFKVKLRDKIGK
jgi:hypothetical protein